jgi:hypothetical protein
MDAYQRRWGEMVSMHSRQCIIVVKWIKVAVVVVVVMMSDGWWLMALLVKCGVAGEIKYGGVEEWRSVPGTTVGHSPWHDFGRGEKYLYSKVK